MFSVEWSLQGFPGCEHLAGDSYGGHFLHTTDICTQVRGRLCHLSEPYLGVGGGGFANPLSFTQRCGVGEGEEALLG